MEPLKQTTTTLSVLQQASETFSRELTLDNLLQHLADFALLLIGDDAPMGCISHIALKQDEYLTFKTSSPANKIPHILGKSGKLHFDACGIIGTAASRAEAQMIDDVIDDDDQRLLDEHTRSQVAIPVTFQDRVLAVLSVEHPHTSAFQTEDIAHLKLLANMAAIAIDRLQQEEKRTRRTLRKKLAGLTAKMEDARQEAERSERLRATALALIETFSHFHDTTERDKALDGFWRMIDALLPEICHHIGAEIGVVLQEDHNHFQIETQYPLMYSPEDTFYSLNDDEWDALLHHHGGIYATTIDKFVHDYDARLPFQEWVFIDPEKTEIVVMLVDGYTENSRMILILAAQTNANATWFEDQDEIFNLIALRLRELYNAACKLDTQMHYEKDRQQFIQDVMHQLVGPLGGLKADAEALLMQIVPEEEKDDTLKRLVEQASLFQGYAVSFSLAAQSTSILQISERTFDDLHVEQLIDLLDRHTRSFQGQAVFDRIDGPRVIRETFEDFPILSVNEEYFGILLLNLYDNAVKYSYKGYNAPIHVTGKILSRSVEIMISNHGIRLEPRDVKRIFERYARAESAQEYAPIGTGIGLYLCDKIMKLHGGSITVAPSRPSSAVEGAHEVTFTLRLPIGR